MLPTRLGKGSRIGAWEIVSPLGQGGMGTVFVARDAMGRTVALKVLLPGMLPDATARRRFEREAEAAARLAHPNVARVHSAGEAQGTPYLVLELATKGSLGRAMKERGKFPWREAALLGVGIARGLEAIHAAGFVHRDLKPDNVLLDDEGRPRVTDFGLVSSLDPSGRSLTQTGELLGTPAYMAPEQANAKDKVDFRADLYSLGATLHALLTGGPPFDGSGVAVLQKVLMERPPGARRAAPDVPRDFEAFILELLEKEPGRRPSSAGQVALELESIARTGRRTTRRGRRLVLGLPALAVVAAAVIFFSRARQGGEPSLPSVAVIPSSNDTKFLEGEAVAALAMNAIDLARGHAERAVSIAPKDAFALGLLAEARARAHRPDAAIEAADRALALDAALPEALAAKGLVLAFEAKWEDAFLLARRALERPSPRRPFAAAVHAFANFYRSGPDEVARTRDALDAARKATADEPKLPLAWTVLALGAWRQEMHAEMARTTEVVARLDPDGAWSWFLRGCVLAHPVPPVKPDANAAVAAYDGAIERSPGRHVVFFSERGSARFFHGELDLALKDGKVATEIDPTDWRGWLLVALVTLYKGDMEEAAKSAQKVLDVTDDRNAWGHYILGRTLLATNDVHGAQQQFLVAFNHNDRYFAAVHDYADLALEGNDAMDRDTAATLLENYLGAWDKAIKEGVSPRPEEYRDAVRLRDLLLKAK